MPGRVLALVDGNCFYASCERLFAPALLRRPVIVLSNNDGCAVARSPEAKALGIKMGQPFHEIRALCRRERVAVFSSNYTLYGDMSARMNEVYRQFTPDVEVYSIDESFLDLSLDARVASEDLEAVAQRIRARVLRWTGIPTCVGIGSNKVLAKVANWWAKKRGDLGGVCDLTKNERRARLLAEMPVGEVWGIGPAYAARLAKVGISTAAELRDADPRLVRRELTVVGARIAAELGGQDCLPMELAPVAPKGCAVTRSFGQPVTEFNDARAAVVSFATRAAEKLRRVRMAASCIAVFLHTSPFRPGPARSVSASLNLIEASSDSRDLAAAAATLIERIWMDGFAYSGAGVMLSELVPTGLIQRGLLPTRDPVRAAALMTAIDAVNRRYGRGTVGLAGAGLGRAAWQTQFSRRSPRYTTRLDELPVVRC